MSEWQRLKIYDIPKIVLDNESYEDEILQIASESDNCYFW